MGKQKQEDVLVNPEKFLSDLCKCYLIQSCDYIRRFCNIHFSTFFFPQKKLKEVISESD